MLLPVATTLACVLIFTGAVVPGWLAMGWFGALLLGLLAGYVVFRMAIPAAWWFVEAGSIRQGKRALRLATAEGSALSVLGARARLWLARWQRRR